MSSVPFNYNLIWTEYKSGLGTHITSWVIALALHMPLFFMRLDMTKPHTVTDSHDKLLSGIEVINEIPKPDVAPPPPPAAKTDSWKDKLAKLMTKAPPPPPPPVKKVEQPTPDKLDTGPKQIELKPKLDALAKMQPKLESKSGFAAELPKNLQDKKIDLKPINTVVAPLSASKVGIQDKGPSKISKEGFKMASADKLSGIGGGPALADPSAPSISINTSRKATSEGFSKAPPQLTDKKGFSAGTPSGLGKSGLTLREQAILKEVGSTKIAMGDSKYGRPGGVEGGIPGGTGSASDKGRYAGGGVPGGVAGGIPGGVVGGTGSSLAGVKGGTGTGSGGVARKEKPMFQITGPLKDRPIERKVNPEYPAWAQAQGISASVVIEFTVNYQGIVKDLMVVIRTSGYPKLDQSAMQTLQQWKFAPLPSGNMEDQVGRITFNYQLS